MPCREFSAGKSKQLLRGQDSATARCRSSVPSEPLPGWTRATSGTWKCRLISMQPQRQILRLRCLTPCPGMCGLGDPGGAGIWLFFLSLWDSPQRLPLPGSPFWI